MVDIRGGGSTVSIIDSNQSSLLGTIDEALPGPVHPGAIYLHQGVAYMVETLEEVALVKPTPR